MLPTEHQYLQHVDTRLMMTAALETHNHLMVRDQFRLINLSTKIALDDCLNHFTGYPNKVSATNF